VKRSNESKTLPYLCVDSLHIPKAAPIPYGQYILAQQILVEHDLDVEVNREILKSIRRGEWSEEKLHGWFDEKEKQLEEMYTKSTLQHAPDEEAIKDLLMRCLEQHYGSLDQAVKREVPVERMISELKSVIEKYEGR
jgi:hypothetical protein